MNLIRRIVLCVVVLGVGASLAFAQHAHEDLVVGVSGGGQLKVEFGHWGESHMLASVSGPPFTGWMGDHPGFGHLEENEPLEDFYTLADGVAVNLEVVEFEGAFKAYADMFSIELSEQGDRALLGGDHLHAHVKWFIDRDDPAFDQADSPWSATFRLVDTGTTGYSASPEYTLTFVPEPSTLALLVCGGLAAIGRRRQNRAATQAATEEGATCIEWSEHAAARM